MNKAKRTARLYEQHMGYGTGKKAHRPEPTTAEVLEYFDPPSLWTRFKAWIKNLIS